MLSNRNVGTETGTAALVRPASEPGRTDRKALCCHIAARLAASHYEVPLAEALGRRRGTRRGARARHVAMYLAHVVFGLSLAAVGDGFGRDRTTAGYACRVIEDARDDPAFDAALAGLGGHPARSRGRRPRMKTGRKHKVAEQPGAPDAFRRQHGGIARLARGRDEEVGASFVNEAESPLAWLARRKGPDGEPFITPVQLAAGERLRADFTRAGLTPRVTANWVASVAQGRRAGGGDAAAGFTDLVIAAKQRLARTLEAVGPEFAGLLLDVCCFLKGLETVERERHWPPRAARIVLTLALDRLARHYGIEVEARGPSFSRTRSWQADGARPTVDGT